MENQKSIRKPNIEQINLSHTKGRNQSGKKRKKRKKRKRRKK
jgi:hypothetical protein